MSELNTFISSTVAERARESNVLVFPLQCGIGKSSYIRNLIADHLTANEGLIVVTDTITGLKDLAGLPPQDRSFQDYLSGFQDQEQKEAISYLNANRKRIAFLDRETVKYELPNLYSRNGKPIVLMTAQRYISLSPDEIRQLTSGAIPRKTIVFDEKPFFTEQRQISIKQLNQIDTALKMAIDNTVDQGNKDFLILQWYGIMQRITELFRWYENQTATGKAFTAWNEPQLEVDQIDNERFLHLVNDTYRADLDRYNSDTRKDINAVYQALTNGATFTSRKRSGRRAQDGTRYENYFTVVLDNAEMFLDIGAKVIVFDGTADIHPDYDLDYIQMVDCSAYRPPLQSLTIRVIDVNTSKNHLRNSKQLISAIAQDIHARCGNPVVFCHQEQERKLKSFGFSTVDHFGNLKGRNDWRQADTIVQIGLNRFPDECYILTALHNQAQTGKKKKNRIPAALFVKSKAWLDRQAEITRNRAVIADMEQNLFRGAIRQGQQMLFVLYAPAYEVNPATKRRVETDLVQQIRKRYEPTGATVEVFDVPEIKISCRQTSGESSTAQKILDWCGKQTHGKRFKLNQMLKELNLDNRSFQNARNANAGLKRMFDRMKVEGMRGCYQIPTN